MDIAALRAKQLRRGAVNRLLAHPLDETADPAPVVPHKAERIAMEEVRRGFIEYDIPSPIPPKAEPEGEA